MFKRIDSKLLQINPFNLISSNWMLISTGNKDKFNAMTASWGGFGFIWNKNVTFCFIRPQRYTYELIENNDYYSFNFFDEEYKKVLEKCGSVSGRDVDKIKENNLHPTVHESGTIYFEESKLVVVSKKLYFQDINPNQLIDSSIDRMFYPNKDYHRMYIGQVIEILEK